ncbi:two-component system response regulator YesN [Paenibacillus taihuensis]|uniref:Two-component system response regulator YesN n=1 Tax=Paenibacillus taihuensis TaxID=1156355 RepID=A0A3D9S416_9BACL|nr:helix-turn-helix domain-containing protein [Paenibacillus taihuensis]REE87484.1 two-component system response regulator YesN [Paenibacillus taihuensis]
MMKLIVLDDEPIIRQGIVHKIRQTGLPVSVVGEAGDGLSGLELIRTAQPDIVITDIQMPALNGLEFIRMAKETEARAEYVILSGYDDFEYAKQAIKYGVSHYLLKPLEDNELFEVLSGLIERKETENNRVQMVESLKALAESSHETARQGALTRFLQEEDVSVEDGALDTLAQDCVSFTAVVLRLEPFGLPHHSFGAGEEDLLWFAVKNIVTERFGTGGIQGVLVHHSLHRFELVYVLGLGQGQERSAVSSILEVISYGIRNYLKLGLTVGIGPYHDKLKKVQESYREAKQLTKNAILHGANRIYSANGMSAMLANRKSIIGKEDIKMLEDWLKKLETDKVYRWLERRIGSIVQDPNSAYVQAEWFCVDLYLFFNRFLLSNAADAEWTIGEMDDLLRWLQQVTDWHEIAERMNGFARNIVGLLSRRDEATGKEIAEAVKAYIDIHFAEQLSLQSIAERFYIHPNYFSKRFKEKYGESFIDYLTSVRMRAAAELLRDTELKVHQIGERVGFEDPAYFGSVFRKRYGETPKQYRENSTS